MEWQPIDTAPRVRGAIYLGWSEDWRTPETIDWDEVSGKWCIPFLRPKAQPTHWMPLPEPPNA